MEKTKYLNNETNGSDYFDALGFPFGSSKNNKETFLKSPVGRNDDFYNMNHKNRGMALIFNHEQFLVPHLRNRNGTEVDAEKLKDCLLMMDFQVSVYKDLGVKQVLETIEKIASIDHSENDCIAIFILTHGEQGVLFASDGAYKHDHIFENFRSDKCPTLAGKPKIFVIQACQGSKLDSGVTLSTQVDASSYAYKIPVYADFLVAYSTMPGYYSWRNTSNGSWFIQALIAELRESCYTHDLLTILTFVSRRVALDFQSNVPGDIMMNSQKQMPCITSMLIRIVKFAPKSSNNIVGAEKRKGVPTKN